MSKTSDEIDKRLYNHGLAFIALMAFIVAFATARIFTSLHPSTLVQTAGIHFHHFWYGLAMVVAAGWIGIVTTNKKYRPIMALVFGFGGGLIGDEAGLLLTFGNYHTLLTYPIAVGVVVIGALGILFFHSGKYLREDFKGITFGDKIILIGIGIGGMSAIAFPLNQLTLGEAILTIGCALAVAGYLVQRRG
ncbi:MAG: hypothetical protein ACREBS_06320 [Nitrososphaerales archaeon]